MHWTMRSLGSFRDMLIMLWFHHYPQYHASFALATFRRVSSPMQPTMRPTSASQLGSTPRREQCIQAMTNHHIIEHEHLSIGAFASFESCMDHFNTAPPYERGILTLDSCRILPAMQITPSFIPLKL